MAGVSCTWLIKGFSQEVDFGGIYLIHSAEEGAGEGEGEGTGAESEAGDGEEGAGAKCYNPRNCVKYFSGVVVIADFFCLDKASAF